MSHYSKLIIAAVVLAITAVAYFFWGYWVNVSKQLNWSQFFIGIFSGCTVTVFFFCLRLWLRPDIKISPIIVERTRKNKDTQEEEVLYQIKLINCTYFNIEDIEIDMFIMEDYYVGSKSLKNYTAKRLPLELDSYKFIRGRKEKDRVLNDNCYLLTLLQSKFDLKKEWTNKDWVHVQISAYHSMSGFRRVRVKKYTDSQSCVKVGKFQSGETFDLI